MLKFYQEQAVEAERLRAQNGALQAELAGEKQNNAALKGLLQIAETDAMKWRTAAGERAKETPITDQLIASWQRSEMDYKLQISALQKENTSLKVQRVLYAVGSAAVAFWAGRSTAVVR